MNSQSNYPIEFKLENGEVGIVEVSFWNSQQVAEKEILVRQEHLLSSIIRAGGWDRSKVLRSRLKLMKRILKPEASLCSDVTNMLTEDGGDHILMLGRPTYYCCQNSPVLKDFNTLIDGQLLITIQITSWTVSLVKYYLISQTRWTPSVIRPQNGQLVSGYLAVPRCPSYLSGCFQGRNYKTETPEGIEVVEKVENLPESLLKILSRIVIHVINHTEGSVNSLMSQIK